MNKKDKKNKKKKKLTIDVNEFFKTTGKSGTKETDIDENDLKHDESFEKVPEGNQKLFG
jgi:hypothetical protein